MTTTKTKSATPVTDFLREANWRYEEIHEEVRKFLGSRGWRYTCETPTCCWMWEKELADGRRVMVSETTAIEFEQALCEEEEEEEEG